jgi:hypothetical protein
LLKQTSVLIVVIANLAWAQTGHANNPREIISLGANWRFHLGNLTNAASPAVDNHDWRRMDVPHDYVIEGTFAETNPSPQPGDRASWYWLHAFLPTPPENRIYGKALDRDQVQNLVVDHDSLESDYTAKSHSPTDRGAVPNSCRGISVELKL